MQKYVPSRLSTLCISLFITFLTSGHALSYSKHKQGSSKALLITGLATSIFGLGYSIYSDNNLFNTTGLTEVQVQQRLMYGSDFSFDPQEEELKAAKESYEHNNYFGVAACFGIVLCGGNLALDEK